MRAPNLPNDHSQLPSAGSFLSLRSNSLPSAARVAPERCSRLANRRHSDRNACPKSAQRPQPAAVGRLLLELAQQFAPQRGTRSAGEVLETGQQTPSFALQLRVQPRAWLLASNAKPAEVVPKFM